MARFQLGNPHGRRWKKGQSGNPKGRPKIRPIRNAMRELLNADEGTAAEALALHALRRALSGDRDSIHWAKFIRGTTEGHLDKFAPDDDEPPKTDEKHTG